MIATHDTTLIHVQAVQLGWDTWSEICDFLKPIFDVNGCNGCWVDDNNQPTDNFTIGKEARIGLMFAPTYRIPLAIQGDWIVKFPNDKFYVLKPEIFNQLFITDKEVNND